MCPRMSAFLFIKVTLPLCHAPGSPSSDQIAPHTRINACTRRAESPRRNTANFLSLDVQRSTPPQSVDLFTQMRSHQNLWNSIQLTISLICLPSCCCALFNSSHILVLVLTAKYECYEHQPVQVRLIVPLRTRKD